MGINLSNIIFSYPGRDRKVVLNIPKWRLKSGESTLIHGSSGSGKTTFLNIIAGLIRPVNGSIEVLGEQIQKMTTIRCNSFRANNIGYVFQSSNLIPYLNVIDNIRLASKFSKNTTSSNLNERIRKLLITLNVAEQDWAHKARNLSVGQIQRVAIARAIINQPKIIIADEPTSSLDPTNKEIFIKLLMTLVTENKITLVFVSHDISLSRYFNRVELFSKINILENK